MSKSRRHYKPKYKAKYKDKPEDKEKKYEENLRIDREDENAPLTPEQLAQIRTLEESNQYFLPYQYALPWFIVEYFVMDFIVIPELPEMSATIRSNVQASLDYFFSQGNYGDFERQNNNLQDNGFWDRDLLMRINLYFSFYCLLKFIQSQINQIVLKKDLEARIPLKRDECLTKKEAEIRIKMLQEEDVKLRENNQKQFIPAILAIMMYVFLTRGEAAYEVLPLLLFTYVFNQRPEDINAKNNKTQFEKKFLNVQTYLEKIVAGHGELVPSKKDTLKLSYFTYHAKEYSDAQEKTSKEIVCQMMKNVFFKNGLHILFYGRDKIVLGGNINIDSTIATNIKNEIDISFPKYLSTLRLKKQIKEIGKLIGENYFLLLPKKGPLGEDCYEFMLPVPEKYQTGLSQIAEIEKIFPDCKVTFNSSCLSIGGNKSGNEEKLAEFLEMLKEMGKAYVPEIKKVENPINIVHEAQKTTVVPVTRRREKGKMTQEAQPIIANHNFSLFGKFNKGPLPKNKETEAKPEETIKFPAGTYCPNKEGNKIKPIRDTYSTGRFFLLSTLEENDFPANDYSKYLKAIDQPHRVGAYGKGIKGHGFYEQDINKKTFFAPAKIKFGNGRVYLEAQQEITENKEKRILYVTRGVGLGH